MLKFDCIQNHIIRFIKAEANRLYEGGVEDKQCYTGEHHMKIGETAYVYNGELFGLKSMYCSNLECFLENIDELSVKKYIESVPTKRKKKIKKE